MVLWIGLGLFDAYRWLATYPDPDPFYITGPNPLRWIGVAMLCVICGIPASLGYAFFRRRSCLLARDRDERQSSNFFQS
jgi:hypothetical protein